MRKTTTIALILSCWLAPRPCNAQQTPKLDTGKIVTRWAADVDPENVLPEYPRPQMARKQWKNLNGPWDYAIVAKDEAQPEKFTGKILVPFAAESTLSGVHKTVGPENRLWYRRSFTVPAEWGKRRVMLNFDAVDWETTVWVNGTELGTHRGGYEPFSFDITRSLKKSGPQEVVLAVWDPTNAGYQPRGKQVRKPRGIFYTAVTGIWQTVWLEPVAETSIRRLKIVPDVDNGRVNVAVEHRGPADGCSVDVVLRDGDKQVARASGKLGEPLKVNVPDAKLWSPDSPFLYDMKISLLRDGKVVDEVDSYCGMRKISLGKDADGVLRLMLNGKPLFQYGPLDQGWWPDGLYTAPTDEALRYDVEVTRKMGMNMIRKHVKIEPARWYYHCDKLGVLVWQDMPGGDRSIRRNGKDVERSKESADNFRRELKAMIDTHGNAPSIVMWVAFNEGWGQFETEAITDWIKSYDPSRLVNSASGWADRSTGDVKDVHKYPGPGTAKNEEKRAVVLGEFGGLGLPVKGHLWWDKKNWGNRNLKSAEELTASYAKLIGKLRPMIANGLSAAVYTQTTDVEGEVNGLMTYDRAMVKMGIENLHRINSQLYQPIPEAEGR